MRTPKEFAKSVSNGIVTPIILGEVLYSYNKRAKNMRDKEREYRHSYDYYDNEGKYREKKEKYYEKEDKILKLVNPSYIHKVKRVRGHRVRHYDYAYSEEEFNEILNECYHTNSYYDRDLKEEVYFGDTWEEDIFYEYFLFFEVGERTFHSPIEESELSKYSYEIIELEDLVTLGRDTNDLLSTQFCDKVYNLVIKENSKLVA